MLTIHVWPKWLKRLLLTHPLYKSPVLDYPESPLLRAIWIECTKEESVGMVEDVEVTQGVRTRINATDGLRE